MGKAFSEEERNQKKIALMEAALELFHESGTKSLSIRELTKRAGISQGGFYTFWEDKDALVLDVLKYRAAQKLEAVKPYFPASLSSPRTFLANRLYDWCIDLKDKLLTKPLYRDSLSQMRRASGLEANRLTAIYSDFLKELAAYWINNGAAKSVDIDGLVNLFAAAGIFLNDQIQLDGKYFDELLRILIDGGVHKYITV